MAEQLTEAQTRARGDAARVLLESPPFVNAMTVLNEVMQERVMRTGLGQTDERELMFAEYDGLRRITMQLHQWSGEAEMIAAEQM